MQRIRPESVSFPPGPFSRDILRQNSGPKIEYGMKPTPHYRYATARKQLKIAPHGSIADCREPERSSGCDRHTLFHFHSADPPDSPFGHNKAAVVSSEVQCPVLIQKVSSAASRHASSFRRYKRYKQYKPKPGPRPRPGPTSIVTDSTQLSLRSTGADYPSTTPVPWMLQAPRTGDTGHYKPRNCVPRHQMQP